MADFADVVSEIKKTNKAIDNLSQASDPKGAAAAEDKKDAEQWKTNQLNYLKTIASAVGGGKDGPGKEDKKIGGIFGGIASALGALGSGVGIGVGGFMKGIGSAVVAAGPFVVVMTALGAGLAAFGLAIAGATWVVSKLMPDIATGLKEFDDVNGSNLVKVGAGIGALGLGFAAMGGGGAILGVGNLVGSIADGLTGLFGGKDSKTTLIADLKKFSDLKLNVKNIKDNSEAMVSYGVAMTAGGAGTMMKAIGLFTEGTIGSLGKMFGAMPPLESLKLFAAEKINKENVKNNAAAMIAYAGAMATGAGASWFGAVGSIGTLVTNAADGLSKLIGGKGHLDSLLGGMKKFGAAADSIDGAKIKTVADALITYTGAMAVGMGTSWAGAVGGIGTLVTNAADGLSKLIGGEGHLDSLLTGLKKMSAATGIDGAKIKVISNALITYTGAMAVGMGAAWASAGGGIGTLVGNAADALSKLISGPKAGHLDTLLAGMQKMSAATGIDGAKIKVISSALLDYTGAMAVGMGAAWASAGGGIGTLVTNVSDGLSKLIGGKDAGHLDSLLTGLKKMSAATGIDSAVVKKNAAAMIDYATAMAAGAGAGLGTAVGGIANFVDGAVKGITKFFGIAEADPLGDLKKFAATIVTQSEIDQIKLNATAVFEYTKAMGALSALKVGKTFGDTLSTIVSGIGSLFGAKEGGPIEALKNFAALKLDGEKIKKDITALLSILEDKNISLEKSVLFKTILTNIGDGLRKFTGPGSFVDSLAGAATKVLAFLVGTDSPITEVMKLASKSEELQVGADAIGKIGEGLDKMAGLKFDGSKINITKFAEDLKESIPVIEAAIMGSEKVKWFGSNIKLRGLASTDIKWDEAATNMKILREALGVQAVTDKGTAAGGAGKQQAFKLTKVNRLTVNTLIAEKLISRAVEKSAAGQGGSIIVSDQSVKQATDARSTNISVGAREYGGSAVQKKLASVID
jgi:hypothetical protein